MQRIGEAVTLRQMVVGFLIFGTLITGILTFVDGAFTAYDVSYQNDTLASVGSDVEQNSTEVARSAREQAEEVGQGGALAVGGFFLRSVWRVISTTATVIIQTPNILSQLSADIPGNASWFIVLITGIVFTWFAYEIVTIYRGVRT